MKLAKNLAYFSLGGGGYVGLELLWRGRSHGSMFLAGGVCFLLLGRLRRLPRAAQPFAGAAVITLVELATGLLFNRSHGIWDYRGLPMNFLGQICLPYSLLWVPLSAGAMALYGALEASSSARARVCIRGASALQTRRS